MGGVPAVGAWSASKISGKRVGEIETVFGVLRAFFAASFSSRLIRGVCGVIRRGAGVKGLCVEGSDPSRVGAASGHVVKG